MEQSIDTSFTSICHHLWPKSSFFSLVSFTIDINNSNKSCARSATRLDLTWVDADIVILSSHRSTRSRWCWPSTQSLPIITDILSKQQTNQCWRSSVVRRHRSKSFDSRRHLLKIKRTFSLHETIKIIGLSLFLIVDRILLSQAIGFSSLNQESLLVICFVIIVVVHLLYSVNCRRTRHIGSI